MNGRRRVLVVTGTRADFGIWTPVLRAMTLTDALEPRLLVTGMHLDERFGATVEDVRVSGVPIVAEVPCTAAGDSAAEMASSIGRAVQGMAGIVAREAPDWLAVLGDRGEQLAAAIVGLHLRVPIAHLHGGERTRGAVDDTVRDLVSRIAHLHLVALGEAGDRLRHLGEEDWRIHEVGAPGLDDLAVLAQGDSEPVRRAVGLPPIGPYLVVLVHPETRAEREPADDMQAVLSAVAGSGLPALALYPNADAGGRAMVQRLTESRGLPIATVASLPRPDYAVLLAGAAAMVGNSSSGIIEAPLLRVPVVNIGDRQDGRARGDNVIDTAPEAGAITDAIRRAIDPAFRAGLSGRSPYGDGQASSRIASLLASEPINARLLAKGRD